MFDVAKAFASIRSAPFDGDWTEALAQITAAGRGWAGQLVGVSRSGQMLYDVGHGIPIEALSDFERLGGVDPMLNPRAGVLARPHFEVLGDDHVIPADHRERNPFYAELYAPADAPFVCMSRLPGPQGSSVVIAALRTASVGHIADEDRMRFAMLLPHVAAAIRLQARLDGHGKSLMTGALETVGLPAFLLSASGSVVSLTTAAEALAERAGVLRLRRRKIHAVDRDSNARLQAAIRQACRWSVDPAAPSVSVILRGETFMTTAEVAALPRAWGPTRHGAVAIVTTPQLRSSAYAVAA